MVNFDFFGSQSDDYNQMASNPQENQASLTHEVLGGGVAYEAMKAYQDHCAANGQPNSYAKAEEILAGITGAMVDREVETKGMDWIDKEQAKRYALEQAKGSLEPGNDYTGFVAHTAEKGKFATKEEALHLVAKLVGPEVDKTIRVNKLDWFDKPKRNQAKQHCMDMCGLTFEDSEDLAGPKKEAQVNEGKDDE